MEESIKAKAPPVSGVYGLYNRKRYILIGESADIRRALLQHEKKPALRFGLSRPIGFTFEVCSEELRVQRAEELTAEYRPVLRRRFAFTRSCKPRKNQAITGAARINATQHEDRSDPIAADPKAKDKRFYVFADQLVVVILALAVAAVIIGFLGVLTGRKIESRRIVQIPVGLSVEGVGSEPAAQAQEDLSSSDVLTKRHQAQSVGEEPLKGAKTQEKTGKTWTVQVKAAPDKSSADVWAAMLKTKGYHTFIVAADIKGKTWYRVRVGPFDSRQEAETMRKILDSQEGFSDAFLARSEIADPPPGPKGNAVEAGIMKMQEKGQ